MKKRVDKKNLRNRNSQYKPIFLKYLFFGYVPFFMIEN